MTRADLQPFGITSVHDLAVDDFGGSTVRVTVDLAAEAFTLSLEVVDDEEPYELGDNETDLPAYVFGVIATVCDPAGREVGYSSLWSIGVDDIHDPYLLDCLAEDASEACRQASVNLAPAS